MSGQRPENRQDAQLSLHDGTQDDVLRFVYSEDPCIDPALLLSPRGMELGAPPDIPFNPIVFDGQALLGAYFNNPQAVDEQIKQRIMIANNNPLPYVPGRAVQERPAVDYNNDFPNHHAQSAHSMDSRSHFEDRSLFSMHSIGNTSMTTAELSFQQSGMSTGTSAPNESIQARNRHMKTPDGGGVMSYAAVLRSSTSGQSYSNHADDSVRHQSGFGAYLEVPRGNGYQPQVPRSAQSAMSEVSITPPTMPEVLLCEKDGCPATFKGAYRRGNLRRHMRLRHGADVVYPCNMCRKTFKRSDARLKHMRKDHKGSVAAAVPRK